MSALNTITIAWDENDRPLITVQYANNRDGASTEAATDEFLRELALGISDESAGYLRALIAANESSGAIALADLAEQISVDKKSIESWYRGLGKTVKAMVRESGSANRSGGRHIAGVRLQMGQRRQSLALRGAERNPRHARGVSRRAVERPALPAAIRY